MGKFDTHGGYFAPQGYMKVEVGGSHEENPNGGVQVGVDPEGIPNMLEEGEPVYNDYVYSDNIVAEADILEKHNIPEKYAGKLYSDIADAYVDEATEMPLDPIANNGLNAMLVRLADAQEEQKAIKQQKELEEELSQLSPEELDELEQMLAAQEGQESYPVEAMPQDVVPQTEQQPVESPMYMQPREQPMIPMVCGGHMTRKYLPGGPLRYNRLTWPYKNAYNQFEAPLLYGSDEPITPLRYGVPVVDVVPDAVVPPVEAAPKSPIATTKSATKSAGAKPVVSKASDATKTPLAPIDTTLLSNPGALQWVYDQAEDQKIKDYLAAEEAMREIDDLEVPVADTGTNGKQGYKPLPTWPRYTGALTAGLLGLYNAFQKPDKYTMPHYRPVLPSARMHLVDPVYTPIDQNQLVNTVLANSAGTTRAIRNAGMGPSTGALLLAQDYNTGRSIGEARRQAWEANNAARNAVNAAHNQNAATLGNFQYGQNKDWATILNDAAVRNAQNDFMLQRMNYAAEGEKYAAIQNQIDALAQALSDIGRENAVMNMINGDETRNYGYDRRFDPNYRLSSSLWR